MSDSIGFAIIGTGMIADFHAEAIRQVPGAKLVAAYLPQQEKCAEFAAQQQLPGGERVWRSCVQRSRDPRGLRDHAEWRSCGAAGAIPGSGQSGALREAARGRARGVDRILAAAERGGGVLAGVFQAASAAVRSNSRRRLKPDVSVG